MDAGDPNKVIRFPSQAAAPKAAPSETQEDEGQWPSSDPELAKIDEELAARGDWSTVYLGTDCRYAGNLAPEQAKIPGHRVFVLDPFQLMRRDFSSLFPTYASLLTSCGFNPIAALDPWAPSFADDAKALARALISTEESFDPYWLLAARALVEGLIMVLRLDKPGHSDSLVALRDYLGKRGLRSYFGNNRGKEVAAMLDKDIERFGGQWPAVAATLGRFAHGGSNNHEIGEILNTALAQTKWLDNPLIRADLTKPNKIDFISVKEFPTTVYIIMPLDQLPTYGVWLRVIMTAARRAMLRAPRRARMGVQFIHDEGAAFC
jgi:type IV secretory pathway TraG/TraD family ATPase VirD4